MVSAELLPGFIENYIERDRKQLTENEAHLE
jgi:hypothetical protein